MNDKEIQKHSMKNLQQYMKISILEYELLQQKVCGVMV